MRKRTQSPPARLSRASATANSINGPRRSPAPADGGRMWTAVGSAASTGLKGTTSQARKPQTTPSRSGPPPPSVTTNGSRPLAICRNQSS